MREGGRWTLWIGYKPCLNFNEKTYFHFLLIFTVRLWLSAFRPEDRFPFSEWFFFPREDCLSLRFLLASVSVQIGFSFWFLVTDFLAAFSAVPSVHVGRQPAAGSSRAVLCELRDEERYRSAADSFCAHESYLRSLGSPVSFTSPSLIFLVARPHFSLSVFSPAVRPAVLQPTVGACSRVCSAPAAASLSWQQFLFARQERAESTSDFFYCPCVSRVRSSPGPNLCSCLMRSSCDISDLLIMLVGESWYYYWVVG
jgi:hypothetical protein